MKGMKYGKGETMAVEKAEGEMPFPPRKGKKESRKASRKPPPRGGKR